LTSASPATTSAIASAKPPVIVKGDEFGGKEGAGQRASGFGPVQLENAPLRQKRVGGHADDPDR
jgi:hypothetical protein